MSLIVNINKEELELLVQMINNTTLQLQVAEHVLKIRQALIDAKEYKDDGE